MCKASATICVLLLGIALSMSLESRMLIVLAPLMIFAGAGAYHLGDAIDSSLFGGR